MLDTATFQMQVLICRLTGAFPPASEAEALNATAMIAAVAILTLVMRRSSASH